MSLYVDIEKLIDGVMASLRDDVLPDVATARARARVWAILDILNNLRDRIEPKCEAAQAECDSVRDAVLAAEPSKSFDAQWGKSWVKPTQIVGSIYDSLP